MEEKLNFLRRPGTRQQSDAAAIICCPGLIGESFTGQSAAHQDAALQTRNPEVFIRYLDQALKFAAIAGAPYFAFGGGQKYSWHVDEEGKRRATPTSAERSLEDVTNEIKRGFLPGCEVFAMARQLRDLRSELIAAAESIGVRLTSEANFRVAPLQPGDLFQPLSFLPEGDLSPHAAALVRCGERIQTHVQGLITLCAQQSSLPLLTIDVRHGVDLAEPEIKEIETMGEPFLTANRPENIMEVGLAALRREDLVRSGIEEGATIFRAVDSGNTLQSFICGGLPDKMPNFSNYRTFPQAKTGVLRIICAAPDAPDPAYPQLFFSTAAYMTLVGASRLVGWVHGLNTNSFNVNFGRYGFEAGRENQRRSDPRHYRSTHTLCGMIRDLELGVNDFEGSKAFLPVDAIRYHLAHLGDVDLSSWGKISREAQRYFGSRLRGPLGLNRGLGNSERMVDAQDELLRGMRESGIAPLQITYASRTELPLLRPANSDVPNAPIHSPLSRIGRVREATSQVLRAVRSFWGGRA